MTRVACAGSRLARCASSADDAPLIAALKAFDTDEAVTVELRQEEPTNG